MALGNNVKNISLCVTEVFILCLWPACLLYVTGMLKCKPSCLMLFLPVMMAAAAICITDKSPLVDILFPLFSPSFPFSFFLSFFFLKKILSTPFLLPSHHSAWPPGSLGTGRGRFLSGLETRWLSAAFMLIRLTVTGEVLISCSQSQFAFNHL